MARPGYARTRRWPGEGAPAWPSRRRTRSSLLGPTLSRRSRASAPGAAGSGLVLVLRSGAANPSRGERRAVVRVARGDDAAHTCGVTESPLGHRRWAIADGYIPRGSHGPEPEMTSHETASILNASDRDADVRLTIYFADREPAGPFRVTVPARRTRHVRFNDLTEPEPIPLATDFSCVIESDTPIVVQHTRLDSRQAENALITTIAFPA
nr:sensory rhodopsin transducer [Nannocystis pusilla]